MAKRAIKPGEELAYYYGEEYFEQILKPIGCKCLKCVPEKKRGAAHDKAKGLRSRRMTFAALWPGAPVTPPPGCAPDPQ